MFTIMSAGTHLPYFHVIVDPAPVNPASVDPACDNPCLAAALSCHLLERALHEWKTVQQEDELLRHLSSPTNSLQFRILSCPFLSNPMSLDTLVQQVARDLEKEYTVLLQEADTSSGYPKTPSGFTLDHPYRVSQMQTYSNAIELVWMSGHLLDEFMEMEMLTNVYAEQCLCAGRQLVVPRMAPIPFTGEPATRENLQQVTTLSCRSSSPLSALCCGTPPEMTSNAAFCGVRRWRFPWRTFSRKLLYRGLVFQW